MAKTPRTPVSKARPSAERPPAPRLSAEQPKAPLAVNQGAAREEQDIATQAWDTTQGQAPESTNPRLGAPAPQPVGVTARRGASPILAEFGISGLRNYSGYISEEFLTQLQGQAKWRLYREMADNHPVIFGSLLAFELLIRRVDWTVSPASAKPDDVAAADFVASCLDDMEHTWDEFLSEVLTMLTFGFSFHETVYKTRNGHNPLDPAQHSRFDDGRLGWRRLGIRSQDTLLRWQTAQDGTIMAFVQLPPTPGPDGRYGPIVIPMDKGLLFRPSTHKANPEGRSILRGCVTSYITQKQLQFIESVGLERDLAGFPVIYAPAKIQTQYASPQDKATFSALQSILAKIRRDENEGVILPSDHYPPAQGGHAMYELKLVSAGGSHGTSQIDAAIARYDNRMAQSLLTDFLMLGQTAHGARSLGETKLDMMVASIESILDSIVDVFNNHAIPDLTAINGLGRDATPQLKHGDVRVRDVEKTVTSILQLSQSGMPIWPDPELEDAVREMLGLPLQTGVSGAGEGAGKPKQQERPSGGEVTVETEEPELWSKPPAQPPPKGGGAAPKTTNGSGGP